MPLCKAFCFELSTGGKGIAKGAYQLFYFSGRGYVPAKGTDPVICCSITVIKGTVGIPE